MKRYFLYSKYILIALLIEATFSAWSTPESVGPALSTVYEQGVNAYRNGKYDEAFGYFKQVTKERPGSAEGCYYFAITLAQLGRFKEAKEYYEAAIRLEPGSETANLSKRGIEYLPAPDDLDAPPIFRRNAKESPAYNPEDTSKASTSSSSQNQYQNQQATGQTPFGSMDPKSLEMMMMLNSLGAGGGGGSSGGLNLLMLPYLQGMMQQGNSADKSFPDSQPMIPPGAFSSMMMNQMMEELNPFSSEKND